MIRLCDRCRPPFALFVSILISTRTHWGEMGNKEKRTGERKKNSQNDKLPRILRIVDVRACLDVEQNEQLHPLVIFSESSVFPRCLRTYCCQNGGLSDRRDGGIHAHAILHTRPRRGHPQGASQPHPYPCPLSRYSAQRVCTKRSSPQRAERTRRPPRRARGTLIRFDSNRQGCISLARPERHRGSTWTGLARNIGCREIARGNPTRSAATKI